MRSGASGDARLDAASCRFGTRPFHQVASSVNAQRRTRRKRIYDQSRLHRMTLSANATPDRAGARPYEQVRQCAKWRDGLRRFSKTKLRTRDDHLLACGVRRSDQKQQKVSSRAVPDRAGARPY